MTLQRYRADDPALAALLGNAQQRFDRMLAEANEHAGPFYQKIFGEPLDIPTAVDRIIAEVATEGDAALCHYNERFDGSTLPASELRVPATEITAAWQTIPGALQKALSHATEQITAYQRRLLPQGYGSEDWQALDVRWTPLDRVGAYVPGGAGGSLPLCSTVLMNLVPAGVAGVGSRAVVTPPRADGSVAPELLAACHVAGVDEVYRVGGVQAIAALACGTATIPRVDKIVGPGNLFVTIAKRQVYGRVDIDMLAGPSEVLVIADDSAEPAWVAADLLSQAEHDPLTMAILLTTDAAVADAVDVAVAEQLATLPTERRTVAVESVRRFGLAIVAADEAELLATANRIAAEHLEIITTRPAELARGIRHAGAIFLGPWSPEPIGDYVAGPSHTLPTGGSARMWSGIGADTFLKRSSIIQLDQAGFRDLAESAMRLAGAEGLEAHRRSIAIRLQDG